MDRLVQKIFYSLKFIYDQRVLKSDIYIPCNRSSGNMSCLPNILGNALMKK